MMTRKEFQSSSNQESKKSSKAKKIAIGTVAGVTLMSSVAGASYLLNLDKFDTMLNSIKQKVQDYVTNTNSRITELEGQVTTLTGERDNLQTELDTATSNVEQLNSQVEQLNGQIKDKTTQIENLTTERDSLQEQLNSATTSNEQLTAQVNQLNSQLESLTNEKANLETELANTQTELESANNTIAELQESLANKQAEIDNAKTQIAKLQEDLSNEKEYTSYLEGLVNKANNDTQAAEQEISEMLGEEAYDYQEPEQPNENENAGKLTELQGAVSQELTVDSLQYANKNITANSTGGVMVSKYTDNNGNVFYLETTNTGSQTSCTIYDATGATVTNFTSLTPLKLAKVGANVVIMDGGNEVAYTF